MSLRSPPPSPGSAPADAGLIQRAAGSAASLLGRYGLLTLISAVTTIALTRTFGPREYGPYASAVATWGLLGALADFGLSPMLARDTTVDGAPARATYRSAYRVATIGCAVLTAVQIGLAASAGFSSTRGEILLVLAPSMAFNAMNPARRLFYVTFRTSVLGVIDALSAVVQSATVLALLLAGAGPVAVAAVVSVGSIVNNLVILRCAAALHDGGGAAGLTAREVLRRALPLALGSIMVQVYFTVDLVICGWLVHSSRLGDYAVASKLLQLLAGIAGVVISGVLPALSLTAREGRDIGPIVARLWHWLLCAIVPVFVTCAIAAPVAIRLAVGGDYIAAVPYLRILCLAGVISPIVNACAATQVALKLTRQTLTQNAAAMVLNIAGNLVLVPIYGVVAAAWLTLATEVLVAGLALRSLRGRMPFAETLRTSARPAIAVTAMLAVELAGAIVSDWLSAVAGLATFLLLATALRAWPPEVEAITRRASGRLPGRS